MEMHYVLSSLLFCCSIAAMNNNNSRLDFSSVPFSFLPIGFGSWLEEGPSFSDLERCGANEGQKRVATLAAWDDDNEYGGRSALRDTLPDTNDYKEYLNVRYPHMSAREKARRIAELIRVNNAKLDAWQNGRNYESSDSDRDW